MKLFQDYKNFPKTSGIYKITTLHNNEFYIGSALSLRKRMKDHINDLKGKRHFVNRLQRSFGKYGECDFTVEFLFISPNNFKLNSDKHRKLVVLEEVLINKLEAKYNTIKTPTTQINNPSTSKIVYQYAMNGEFIKEWCSSMEVQRILNIQPQNSLKDLNRSAGGFRWSNTKYTKLPKYKANQGNYCSKQISIYDLFGTLIKTFDSITECAKEIFPDIELKKSIQNIRKYSKDSRVLNGYRYALGNDLKLDNSINLKHRINFIVLQYDLKMNFINIYGTLQLAQKATNVKSIYDNLSGKTKQAGGFVWQKLQ